MTLSEIRDKVVEPCRRCGVKRLELFGSRARGDASADSDADFLVEFINSGWIDSFDRFMSLRDDLECALGAKVDLLTAQGLRNPVLIRTVDRDRVTVYE